MYKMTCPDCAEPLAGDAAEACSSCGWPSRRAELPGESSPHGVVVEPAVRAPGEKAGRPGLKKRRKRLSDDFLTGRPRRQLPGYLAPAAVALVAALWAVLAGLTFASPDAAYGLAGCGVVAFLVGTVWLGFAAREEGIEVWAPWESSGVFLGIPWAGAGVIGLFWAALKFGSLPILSILLLWYDFTAALPPVLLLLLGLGMAATGYLLAR